MRKNYTSKQFKMSSRNPAVYFTKKKVVSVSIGNWQEPSIAACAPNTYALDAHEFEVSLGYRAKSCLRKQGYAVTLPTHRRELAHRIFENIQTYEGESKTIKENFKNNVPL